MPRVREHERGRHLPKQIGHFANRRFVGDNVDVRLIEVPSPVGPLGAKGVGEPPAIPGTAALANAVSRAAGVRVREAPIDRFQLVSTDGR